MAALPRTPETIDAQKAARDLSRAILFSNHFLGRRRHRRTEKKGPPPTRLSAFISIAENLPSGVRQAAFRNHR
jgi:hypothetical protein